MPTPVLMIFLCLDPSVLEFNAENWSGPHYCFGDWSHSKTLVSGVLPHQEELWERCRHDLQIPERVSQPAVRCAVCVCVFLCCHLFWLLLFSLYQGFPQAKKGGESPPPQRPKGERERLHVSRAQEDDPIRSGLSSQWADLGGEEAGGGGLL